MTPTTNDVTRADRFRLAAAEDADAIDALMKASIRDIFPSFYDAGQTASSIEHISSVDKMLIDDGTYFVVEEDDEVIACGGWSRRDKLYTGSGHGSDDARLLDPATEPARVRAMFVRGDRTRRGLGRRILEACEQAARAEGFRTLALMATLPGVLLYEHYGFRETHREVLRMPDGVEIEGVAMEMPVRADGPISRDELVARIRADREFWRTLRDEVGRDRMNEPGPMGDWTFKDLVSHLAGWRNRRIAQLEAAGRGEAEPPSPWPAHFDDDDTINAWIRERDGDRTLDDLLADYDGSFERLAAAIEALPHEALTDPNHFPWMEGTAAIAGDYFAHLHEDHAPSAREWLAQSRTRSTAE